MGGFPEVSIEIGDSKTQSAYSVKNNDASTKVQVQNVLQAVNVLLLPPPPYAVDQSKIVANFTSCRNYFSIDYVSPRRGGPPTD